MQQLKAGDTIYLACLGFRGIAEVALAKVDKETPKIYFIGYHKTICGSLDVPLRIYKAADGMQARWKPFTTLAEARAWALTHLAQRRARAEDLIERIDKAIVILQMGLEK